jgi:ATP-dependent RNA helicase DHX37/DHR1
MKEKRRRAVHFSKAGLDVPEELSLFKKNCDPKGVPEDSEPAPEASPVKFKAAKLDQPCSQRKNHENDSVKPMMGLGVSILEQKTEGTKDDAGILAHQSIPEQKIEETNDDADILAHQTVQSSVPNCSAIKINLQVIGPHLNYFRLINIYN